MVEEKKDRRKLKVYDSFTNIYVNMQKYVETGAPSASLH